MAERGPLISGNNLKLVKCWPSGTYRNTRFHPFVYPGPANRIIPINIQKNEIDVHASRILYCKYGVTKDERKRQRNRWGERFEQITEYLVVNLERDNDYYKEKGILQKIPKIERTSNEPQVIISRSISILVDEHFHQLFRRKILYPVVFYMNGEDEYPNKLTITLYNKLRSSYSFFKIICHDLLDYTNQRFGDLFVISKNIKSTSPLRLAINPNYTFLKLYIFAEEEIGEIAAPFIVIGKVDVNRKFLDFQNPNNPKHKPVNILAVGFEIITIIERRQHSIDFKNSITNLLTKFLLLGSITVGIFCLNYQIE